MISPPKVPCGTCPYRKNVPSGIWDASEYAKLAKYDLPTWEQPPMLFLCHQQDGCLCGGWIMTHDRDELLALRFHARNVDPAVWTYAPAVEVFASGEEAAAHGMAEIDNPSPAAVKKIEGLQKRCCP